MVRFLLPVLLCAVAAVEAINMFGYEINVFRPAHENQLIQGDGNNNADGSNQHPLPVNVALDYGYTDEQMVSWGK